MPELPEVEVSRLGLLPYAEGQAIRAVVVREFRMRLPIPADLPTILQGRTVVELRRRGKYLLLACDNANGRGWLIVHLGMSGSLRVVAPGTPAGRHDHVDLIFAGGIVRLRDPRRFGVVLWQDGADPAAHPLIAGQGLEPLAPQFTAVWLREAAQKRSIAIKELLMDSHTLVGVGNIYAAESLFRAGISPLRQARRIGHERLERLVAAVQETLREAIAAGGSSVRDYVHSDGGAGSFQLQVHVYGRTGQTCHRCGGTIRQIRQGGRSTFYCPDCQH
jgi:formamidopyrimidine-DNA glycosylase